MIDIVSIIKDHTENLKKGLSYSSVIQRKKIIISITYLFFSLPDSIEIIKNYFNLSIEQKQLIKDIFKVNTEKYLLAIEKSNSELDEYLDTFEESTPIEIFILNLFSNLILSLNNSDNLVSLFTDIIDILDYYENFSEKPTYWNDLIEKEVIYQNKIINKIKNNKIIETNSYYERYKNVIFSES